jgi:hypothetical protein
MRTVPFPLGPLVLVGLVAAGSAVAQEPRLAPYDVP